MGRRGVLGLLAGGSAVLLSSCGSRSKLRYKMTVDVDTPSGVRTGFAVREVRFSPKSGTFFAEGSARWKLRGEAVAVDLPGGRTLFALLTSQNGQVDYAGRDIWMMLENAPKESGQRLSLWPAAAAASIPADRLPMLVTFRDLSDPTSVQRVDPANLAATFGPGVRLKRIIVETTHDDVTTGIERRLEWLSNVYATLRGSTFKPEGIPVGDFKRLFSTMLSK